MCVIIQHKYCLCATNRTIHKIQAITHNPHEHTKILDAPFVDQEKKLSQEKVLCSRLSIY